MRLRRWKKYGIGALAAVVLGVAAGGIAYASIPDSNAVIHGCYQKSNGSLRVIDTDAGAKCVAGEKPLNWNQTGPSGATNVVERDADGPLVEPQSEGDANVFCNPGEVATGGGWHLQFGVINAGDIENSEPLSDANGVPRGWRIRYFNAAPGERLRIGVKVICASP